MAKETLPSKPYADYPLFPHRAGQWAKKINGSTKYFGSWRIPGGGWKEALAKYQEERDDLFADRLPASRRSDWLADTVNEFLDHQRRRVDSGEMALLSWQQQRRVLAKVVGALGRTRPLGSLTHADWSLARGELAKGLRLESLKQHLGVVNVFLNWAFETGVIAHKVSSPSLKPPKMAAIRRQRAERGPLVFSREEILALLNAADTLIKACILLACNTGIAAADIDQMRWRHIDRAGGWLNLPRAKTGVQRRAKLWKRTLAAVDKAAVGKGHDDVILHGPDGERLAADCAGGKASTTLGRMLHVLCADTGLQRRWRNFHALRRAYATAANQTGDAVAVAHTMGHQLPGDDVASVYRVSIDDSRLVKVAAHVERWLFGRRRAK